MSDEQSFTMPSNPVDRKRIKDALHEMTGHLQFIEDRREAMKDIADVIAAEHSIPKKILVKMARTLHKHNYLDVVHESDVFTTMFETLFQSSGADVDADGESDVENDGQTYSDAPFE